MVEAAGLTVDDFKDTTWSDFMEKAKKVVETNNVPMLTSSGGSEIIIEMLQSAGASPMVDGKVDLVNNKALKKAIETYKQLIDEGIMVDYTDWDQYIASMNKGTAAGVIQGCWIMSSMLSCRPFGYPRYRIRCRTLFLEERSLRNPIHSFH